MKATFLTVAVDVPSKSLSSASAVKLMVLGATATVNIAVLKA